MQSGGASFILDKGGRDGERLKERESEKGKEISGKKRVISLLGKVERHNKTSPLFN